MLSDAQEQQVRNEIITCINLLVNDHLNTYEISSLTGISQSTVHRRLTDNMRINDIYIKLGKTHDEVEEIMAEIKRLMELNKEIGLSNGGSNFQEKYAMERDNKGHFVGHFKK